ncbi:FUSC family protein [Frondihabitans cladoniiphilus]|uniref:FUSC family protein n=1 Tax=Frondihabitans cladoniiphilus TaxID=715785 RepID=UPI0031E8B6C5
MTTTRPAPAPETTPAPSLLGDWRREVVRVGPHNYAHWGSIRVGLSVVAPIAILALSGHPTLTLYAVFGAMAGIWGRHNTYGERLRVQSIMGVGMTVAVVAGTLSGLLAPGTYLPVAIMTVISIAGLLLSRSAGLLPVPSLFFVFAVGSTSAVPHTPSDLVPATLLPLAAAAFAILVGQIGRLHPNAAAVKNPRRPAVRLVEVLRTPGVKLDIVRYGAGPLLAGGIATAVGIGHPYWAAVSATVPLAGVTLGSQLGRGTQRFLGTVLGLAIAALVFSLNPPLIVLLVFVAACQIWAELFSMRNYAITVIGVTPLALTMVHLASPLPIDQLIGQRFLETLIGVVVAAVVLIATRPFVRRVSS